MNPKWSSRARQAPFLGGQGHGLPCNSGTPERRPRGVSDVTEIANFLRAWAVDTLSIEEARRIALWRARTPGRPRRPPAACRHGAPPGSGPTRHHLGPGAVARVGGLRPPGGDRACTRGAGVLGPEERHLRVLVTRRVRAATRGLAGLRVQAPGATRQGQAVACARRARQDVRRGPGPPARRGTADRQRARRRQEGRPMVGLVRGQDRGGVVARHRRGRVPRASRLCPRLRPGGARHSGATPGHRHGATKSARCNSSPQRGARSAWRPRPTWRCTTACRARWSAGCWTRPG